MKTFYPFILISKKTTGDKYIIMTNLKYDLWVWLLNEEMFIVKYVFGNVIEIK